MATGSIDIIWNISLVCPWDCQFCCTDAVHVKRNGNLITIREFGLRQQREMNFDEIANSNSGIMRLQEIGVKPNIFDLALQDRQNRNLELTYEQKVRLLQNILPFSPEIDFSGGDPLACYENFLVMQEAKKIFGRESISVTATGASMSRYNLVDIAETVDKFEFTFDEPVEKDTVNRPLGYNSANLSIANKLGKLNVKTKAQSPLHEGNLEPERIYLLYNSLHQAGVDELLLMRVFPVGRGSQGYNNNIKRDDYLKAIEQFRKLEDRLKYPKVRLQCALKHIEQVDFLKNPCDLMQNSFGINPSGILLLSAWATNSRGEPLDNAFILGNLSENSFESLLQSETARDYSNRLDQNWGHCKIFSFLFSDSKSPQALFEKRDPLYI